MIFETDQLSFLILDVMELDQSNVNRLNRARSFFALSFRTEADTVLSWAGGERHLHSHDVSLVPAHLDYRRISRTDRLIVVHFEIPNDVSADGIEAFTPEHPERLEALFRRLLLCWQGKEVGYRHMASAILYEILAECYRQREPKRGDPSRISASVGYLHAHYTDPHLSIPEVAARSYMSEVYFRRLFRAEFGVSPRAYIIGLRIRHAIGLLVTGYHSLPEVAYLSGYSDYKYFSVEFKRHTGLSPSQYRERSGA